MNNNFIGDILRYRGDPSHPYEMLSEREHQFFVAITSDEDLVAVLRGHLYIEADVNELLAHHFPASQALIDDLSYEQKIRRLRKSMELPRDVATLMKALGELRNAFAHNLERSLTAEDDSRFFDSLDPYFKPGVDSMIAKGAFPKAEGARVRACVLVLHTALSAIGLGLRGAAPTKPAPTGTT